MYKIFFILLSVALVLSGCSGKDKLTVDNDPPLPPVMTPHWGDTGDLPVHIGNEDVILNDENNGIDAVPDGNWIRISWDHLLDSDLDYLKIYRFSEFSPVPALIDSISATREYYVDNRQQLDTNVMYSYFIKSVDTSGNSAQSDTVSYGLLSKQVLDTPANGATLPYNGISFSWQKSGFVSKFRLLVLNENSEYIWHRDIQVANEGDFFTATFPVNLAYELRGQALRWRIDAFDTELNINIGSESEERFFAIASK